MNQQPQSETPETDAAVFKIIGSLQSGTEDVVHAEKCRDLERRLRAAEETSAQWSYCAKAFCDSISNPYQLGVSERCEKALKLMAALEDGEDTTGVNPFLELASLEAKLTAAEAERDDLARWKREALEVANQLQEQEIGKEIGLTLGQRISPAILPWIKGAKAKLTALG